MHRGQHLHLKATVKGHAGHVGAHSAGRVSSVLSSPCRKIRGPSNVFFVVQGICDAVDVNRLSLSVPACTEVKSRRF